MKTNTYKNTFLILLLLFFWATQLIAQPEGVIIYTYPEKGDQNTRFTLQVTLDLSKVSAHAKLIDNPNFENLGQSTRSETSIINGNISQKYTISFSLTALKDGTLKLPDIEIKTNNGLEQIKTGQVLVTKSAETKDEQGHRTLRFQQSVSELEVYQGEQIVNALDAYSPHPINAVDLSTLSYPDFWVEQLGEDKLTNYTQRNQRVFSYNGRRAIYALVPGTLTLPEREARFTITEPIDRRDPFDFFSGFSMFGGQQRTIRLRSNDLEVKVNPLPAAPKQALNWGNSQALVGATNLKVEFKNSPVQTGQSIVVNATIITLGNANPLKKLPLTANKAFKLYEEPVKIGKSISQGKLVMTSEFNFSILPLKAGTLDLGSLELVYFDPASASYKYLKSEPLVFEVLPGDLIEEVENENDSIEQSSIENEKNLYQPATFFERLTDTVSIVFLLWLLVLVVLLAGLIFLYTYFFRKIKPIKSIKTQIEAAHNIEQLKNSFYRLIAFKLNIRQIETYTCKELASYLSTANLPADLLFLLQSTLDRIDYAVFSKELNKNQAIEEIRQNVIKALNTWQ